MHVNLDCMYTLQVWACCLCMRLYVCTCVCMSVHVYAYVWLSVLVQCTVLCLSVCSYNFSACLLCIICSYSVSVSLLSCISVYVYLHLFSVPLCAHVPTDHCMCVLCLWSNLLLFLFVRVCVVAQLSLIVNASYYNWILYRILPTPLFPSLSRLFPSKWSCIPCRVGEPGPVSFFVCMRICYL